MDNSLYRSCSVALDRNLALTYSSRDYWVSEEQSTTIKTSLRLNSLRGRPLCVTMSVCKSIEEIALEVRIEMKRFSQLLALNCEKRVRWLRRGDVIFSELFRLSITAYKRLRLAVFVV